MEEKYIEEYIQQALFLLMRDTDYSKISIVEIARKAGVSRATFYRHYQSKEEIIISYFERKNSEFRRMNNSEVRNTGDLMDEVESTFRMFKAERENVEMLDKAGLMMIYFDYINQKYEELFEKYYPNTSKFYAYGYAGAMFNMCVAWMRDGFKATVKEVSRVMTGLIMGPAKRKNI